MPDCAYYGSYLAADECTHTKVCPRTSAAICYPTGRRDTERKPGSSDNLETLKHQKRLVYEQSDKVEHKVSSFLTLQTLCKNVTVFVCFLVL